MIRHTYNIFLKQFKLLKELNFYYSNILKAFFEMGKSANNPPIKKKVNLIKPFLRPSYNGALNLGLK